MASSSFRPYGQKLLLISYGDKSSEVVQLLLGQLGRYWWIWGILLVDLGGFLGVCPVEEPLTLFEAMRLEYQPQILQASYRYVLVASQLARGAPWPRGDIT